MSEGEVQRRKVVEVRSLVKRFGVKTVLKDLSFQVEPGEFVALLGPNGAGKSTFLRILSSLSSPTLGLVRVAGFDLPRDASRVRRRLGVVSHQPLLYGDLTAEENLLFFARLYSLEAPAARIQAMLELVGMDKRRRDLVRTFSRGMQQRLAIARAVLHDPDVLLLDEPHTGLDQDACEMLDRILRQVSEGGRTIVMASHDLSRAEDLASRYDVLSRGRIRASLPRTELARDGFLAFYRQSLEGGA